jgi:uncharacterized protein
MSSTWFAWGSYAGAALIVAAAAIVRGRPYAIFLAVLLTIHVSISVALFESFAVVWPLYVYLQLAVLLHFALLARPVLRPLAYRAFVSVPASYFAAGTFLASPWAIGTAFGAEPVLPHIAYGIATLGLLQSLRGKRQTIDLAIVGESVPTLGRHAHGAARVERPLRLVQITDPHLGPFMSVERLRRICERAVEQDPDLVLLTGDFMTMEAHHAQDALARAFEPLAKLEGRVYACHGNHDHEAPRTVAHAMTHIGARLLVDDACTVETPAGRVQIVGMDFRWRGRREAMAKVCDRFPREPGALRLVLLHDPGAFKELGDGEGDLVLSGHTHGGQLGLVSLGIPATVVSVVGRTPDHGLWALGKNRMYVHRGTGHYGFPLRLGVPSEESLVRVHAPGLLTPPASSA